MQQNYADASSISSSGCSHLVRSLPMKSRKGLAHDVIYISDTNTDLVHDVTSQNSGAHGAERVIPRGDLGRQMRGDNGVTNSGSLEEGCRKARLGL